MTQTHTPEQIDTNRRKFLAALREPGRTQTFGGLARQSGRRCAFGVACDALELGSWQPAPVADALGELFPAVLGPDPRLTYVIDDTPYTSVVPFEIRVALDMDAETHNAVLEMNDGHHLPFAEIADRLEAHWFPAGV